MERLHCFYRSLVQYSFYIFLFNIESYIPAIAKLHAAAWRLFFSENCVNLIHIVTLKRVVVSDAFRFDMINSSSSRSMTGQLSYS